MERDQIFILKMDRTGLNLDNSYFGMLHNNLPLSYLADYLAL